MDFVMFAQAAQGVLAVVTLSMFIIRPFREVVLGTRKARKQEEDEAAKERESVKCLLRNDIVCIYFAKRVNCSLHQYEFENLSMLYAAYKRMGGNSFVDRIWEEIQEWEIIP